MICVSDAEDNCIMYEQNTQKLKIAQVVGNAKSGGVISYVLSFYRCIDRDKFQFDFFTYGESPFDDEIRALGGRVFYIPNVLSFFKSVKAMKNFFSKEDYFAVHAHITTLSFVPLLAAKRAGVKRRICHSHTTAHPSEKVWIVKTVLKHISKLYPTTLAGCSRYACRWLYGKRKGDEAMVIKNAVDLDKFCRDDIKSAALKREYGLEERKIIGHIGRFEVQKNHKFLVEAFAMLALDREDVDLVLVGGGSLVDDVREQIKTLRIENRVHIFTDKRDVEEYFALFDLFVLPSLFEGLGRVAIEAQAMGIPCLLSSNIPDEADVSGHCKFLPVASPGVWADAMNEALDTQAKFDGKELVAQHGFDIIQEAITLAEFYEGLK